MQNQFTKTKIAIIGGHFTPAVAVKSVLKKNGFNNLIWIGSKYSQTQNKNYSLEYLTIQKSGIKFVEMKAGKLWRKFTLKTLIPGLYNTLLIPYGFLRALVILIKYNPALVISFGGHLALPVVIMAKVLGKKVITHEQTIVSGLTNKTIARFSDVICVSWEDSLQYFPVEKTVYTGLPIRNELFEKKTEQSFSKKLFDNNLPVLFVTGGNQGANTLNWRLLKILPELLEKMNIIHITGNSTITNDYKRSVKARDDLSEKLRNKYHVLEIADSKQYYNCLNNADFVLSRAGANTIAEILAVGKLSVLVPIPWSSNNEQELNAKIVAKTGLGLIVKQYDNLTPEEIHQGILKAYDCYLQQRGFNGKKLEDIRQSAKTLVTKNAAENFYLEIVNLLKR